jgi:GNAT superfamily N-acetyltransferase
MGVRVRQFGDGDLEVVAALLRSLGYPATPEAVRARIAKLTAGTACTILVAESDNSVVGLAAAQLNHALEYDKPIARLIALAVAVAERARRTGIGTRLTDAIESWARDQGAAFVSLTTNDRRADAHAFYRRAGYEENGRRFVKRF